MKKQLFAGKFEIQGEISKGQTGTIYYGYDMGLRQEVAIKIYHSHINGRLIRGQAFIEKSKPLLLIDHPNLIKIFKVEEEDDTPVVFMEFFDAPSLQQMIHDKGPLPVQDMMMLAREITEVLVHTHFQGIIHGTLHPGHVLVGPQGQIKVMDLGLSWILMDILSNCDEELLRPLPYFPPEIAKGELLNVSSDLYCLGFMMYEMLTGTVPYAGLPKTSIMGKLAFDQADPAFDFPEGVPEAICDLIRHMTRNKTQQRLQDATHALTIINQQLSKLPLSKENNFSAPVSPQPQAPAPKEPDEPKKTSAPKPTTPQPSTPVEPTLKKTPPVQRPQKAVNYGRVRRMKTFRKLGFVLGIVLLVAGGVMGYWYRGSLEQSIRTLSPDQFHSPQETSLPQTTPTKNEIFIAPDQDFLNGQEPQSGTNEIAEGDSPSLSLEKETAIDSSASATPLPRETEIQLDPSNGIQTPNARKPESGKALSLSKTQPDSNQPASPIEKQSSGKTPTVSESTPESSTKAPKKEPLQESSTQEPTKETNNQKKESSSSAVLSEDGTREPTDEEIEELLQALDAPVADVPSLTEPESFINH